MKPLYIFDLDGTLALIEHRRHFVENRANRWDEFHTACIYDQPNAPVIAVLHALQEHADIWIFSGRSDAVYKQTVAWLQVYLGFAHYPLRMREAGDYTPDDKLKLSWYCDMSDEDKARLVAVFDDRDRVVAMWRSQGVACLQVAPGGF